MEDGKGDVKFQEEIVTTICQLVPCETTWDNYHVLGQLQSCKVIQEKSDQVGANSNICVVGLYGVGGIRKTTICKAMCNEFSSTHSDYIVCHVELGSASEMKLLQRALKKLTDISHDFLDGLDDTGEGYAYLRKKLLTQPIFLALDNVQDDHKSIAAAQTFLKASYGPHSVVLVSARTRDVLKKLDLHENQCLEMPELEEDEARSLFVNYASLPSGHEIDEILVKNCIKRCHFLKGDGKSRHYHPLALKVLGQQLGPNSTRWAAQVFKIDTFNQLGDAEHPVFSILRNSFDSLEREQQLVFMDLALLMSDADVFPIQFTGFDLLRVMHEETVEGLKDKLEFLKKKSLLEDWSDNFTRIGMHDLWREFAVVETKVKAQDLSDQRWVYQVDGKRGVLGRIGRWRENVERMVFLNAGWKGLKGLKLDDFVNVTAFKLEVKIYMVDDPLDLDLSGLKQLNDLDVDCPGLAVRARGLRSLTNRASLSWRTLGIKLPCFDEIRYMTKLQYLALWNCEGVEVLDMTELILLRFVGIAMLPDLIAVRGLSSRLANLRYLVMVQCPSLQECPGLGELCALESLGLLDCGEFEDLPWLGRLTNLRELTITGCKSIKAVPGLSDLVALKEFHAGGCENLGTVPDMRKLTKLEELDTLECPVVRMPGLDGLISLKTLSAPFGEAWGELFVFPKLSVLKVVDILGWNGPNLWTSIRNLHVGDASTNWLQRR